jgi:beta-lactamase class A
MRRTGLWISAASVMVIVGGATLIGIGMHRNGDGGSAAPGTAVAGTKPKGPSPEELARQAQTQRAKELNTALAAYARTAPEFSVAVLDKKTGARYSYRGTVKFDTASIVKVQVLACLLLRAQSRDRELTGGELDLAKRMIRLSDNDATTELFNRVGKVKAVTASNKRLGLTQTVVNSSWGLTRTTADDQITLLSKLVDSDGPLDAGSRKLAFTLMNSVDDSQNWGVPSVARSGEISTVKNGWDTRSKDGGLWAVNTVGRVTSANGDVDISVAVLSHNNTSEASGIQLVEKVAKMTRQYLKY